MIFIEYAKVTSVTEVPGKGGQIVNAVGQISTKQYKNVELGSLRGVVAIPKTGDFVLMFCLGTKDYIAFGGLERKNMKMNEGEVMIFHEEATEVGQNTVRTMRAKMHFRSDKTIELGTYDESEVAKAKMVIDQNGDVTITASHVYLP
jgi:hypothetical protein